jgi:hypothetical protein
MVDLSAIPQFDSGILDTPVDRSDVNDKKISKLSGGSQDLYKTGNAKIDSYINSKFNKSVNNITNKLGNFIFNPKKKISYVIQGADILTGGGVSKNAELGVSQLRAFGEDASKQILSAMGKIKNQLSKMGVTHTRGMDKSTLTPEQLKMVNDIDDLMDFEIGLRANYKADTTALTNAIKKEKTPLVKNLSKEIKQAENWKTTFPNVFPGIKTTRQTSKKVSELPGIGKTTPSGAAKVYQFTYKGLAAKHGGNAKLDEIIRNKKHPKHQEVMDTFNDSIRKYSTQMDDLFQYRDDMLESYADDLIEVYTKYGDDIGSGVIDFAHKFPVSQTARMNPTSELLDKAGNPEYLYLSPSFVNRKVQVFFDDLAENLMTGKPLSYVNRPLATQGYKTGTRQVDAFDNMTMNMGQGVYTTPKQFDEFIEIGNKSKNADSITNILNKIDDGLKNVKAQSSYSIYNPKAIALSKNNKNTFNLSLGKNLETKADMKELLNYLLDPSVTKDTLIYPFQEGGKFAEGNPTNSVEAIQGFIEEGVGDKEGSLRTLGTLWNGKLLTGVSSGFGNEYAAENLPILKNLDPLSRGIWNTIAPYGEKAFDILDTAFRLPGAFVADTAEGVFGVDEDKANKLQAELNTMLAMPVAGGPVSNAGKIKAVNNVKKVKNDLKKIEEPAPVTTTEAVETVIVQPLGKPKQVGLGFTSRLNPNTKKLELYDGEELIGSFNSINEATDVMKQINAGKWKGKTDYKSKQSKLSYPWKIQEPDGSVKVFKTKKDANLYLNKNYPESTTPVDNLPIIEKNPRIQAEKTGDFSRYSLMFEDIIENYAPTESKTGAQWIGELKNRGHTKELDKGGFGYTLFVNKNNKLTTEQLVKLRAEKGTQINTKPIRMGNTSELDLIPEFDTIRNQYNDFLNVNSSSSWMGSASMYRGSLPKATQNFILETTNRFGNYYLKVLENNGGRLSDAQDALLNDKIDLTLANIVKRVEKDTGGNAWTPMMNNVNADNFALNVFQAAQDILPKTKIGAGARTFLTNLKNLRRDYGTTTNHATITLPGDAAQKTHKTDVYTYNPLKGQKDTNDVTSSHMGQKNELAHVRKTDRTTLDGQNGTFLDEMQFDVLKQIAKSDRPVFKAEVSGEQAAALTTQLNTLKAQQNRIFNSELKKLLIKSDVDDATNYNLPQNQQALMQRVNSVPDNDPNLLQVKEKILADFGNMENFMQQQGNKAFAKIKKEEDRINSEFSGTPTQETGMPDIPFRQQEDMIKEILKREIELAIQGGKDFVAIPLPEAVMGYEQGSGINLASAFNNIYRKNSLRAANSLLEDYTKRLESLGINSQPFSVKSGNDVDMWISWPKTSKTHRDFNYKINNVKRDFKLDDPNFYKKGLDKDNPLRPFSYGDIPGNKAAIKPGIVIDLRELKGFERKLLAKLGFREYKEGGKTNINKYSALAEVDILGVAV